MSAGWGVLGGKGNGVVWGSGEMVVKRVEFGSDVVWNGGGIAKSGGEIAKSGGNNPKCGRTTQNVGGTTQNVGENEVRWARFGEMR